MPTAWIYTLKKPDLITEAKKRDILTEGLTVDQIRKLLVEAITSVEGFETPKESQSLEMEHDDDKDKASRLGKLIKEWNISFGTSDNAVEFVERLEELVEASGIEKEDVLPALPRILRGRALLWYRNNHDSWDSWEKFLELFKLYYFPSNYEEDLIVRIVARKQKFNESFRDYLTDLQTLMRRYGNLSDKEKLHRIHENMRREYKLYIKKQDYKDLGALLKLAAEFENISPVSYGNRDLRYRERFISGEETASPERWRQTANQAAAGQAGGSGTDYIPRERAAYGNKPTGGKTMKVHPRYDPKTCCWACGKPGHDARECRSRSILFCSGCGKVGVLSKHCCKAQGKRESLGAADDTNREDNRVYVEAEIMGTKHRCLVDTGSTNTYVNEKVYKDCQEKGAPEKETQKGVILADGSTAQVKKSVIVSIRVKGAVIKHCVRVLPSAGCVIIGMDVLTRVGCNISWAGDSAVDQDEGESTTDPCAQEQRLPRPEDTDREKTRSVQVQKSPHVHPPGADTPQGQTLTEAQRVQLEEVLREEFRLCEESPKGNTWVEHKIKMKNYEPIKQRYFPRNPKQLPKSSTTELRPEPEPESGKLSDNPSQNPICTIAEQKWWNNKREQVGKGTEQSQQYRVRDGKLFWKAPVRASSTHTDLVSELKVCVTKGERNEIITENHDSPTTGHLGMPRTIKRKTQRYHWPRMQSDIIPYLKKINAGQKYYLIPSRCTADVLEETGDDIGFKEHYSLSNAEMNTCTKFEPEFIQRNRSKYHRTKYKEKYL